MAGSRFRPGGGGSRAWNPADHPRDPLGRFATSFHGNNNRTVGRSRARSSEVDAPLDDDPWAQLEQRQLAQARQRASAARSAWNASDDLDVIPGHEGAGPRSLDSFLEELRGQESPAPFDGPRDEIMRHPWRGNAGNAPEAVAQLDDYAENAGEGRYSFDPDEADDLSDMGAINAGVIRAELVDGETGEKTGVMIVMKSTNTVDEADAEVLASEVGHAIGAPVPSVRQSPGDSKQLIMEGVFGSPGFNTEAPTFRDGREAVGNYREAGARIAVLDQITGNRDRHQGNWIMTDNDIPVGIDNGLAWGAALGEEQRSAEQIRQIQTGFMKAFDQGNGVSAWAQMGDRISLEEMESWESRLADMAPEFEKRGRSDWHMQMMENYGYLLAEKREEWND